MIAGIATIAISEAVIKKSLRQELAKYNCRLISIEETDDEFTLPELPPVPSWEKRVFVGYRSLAAIERTFEYMEVYFSTPEKKTVKSLVAVRSAFFTSKVYFQVDLNNLQNSCK